MHLNPSCPQYIDLGLCVSLIYDNVTLLEMHWLHQREQVLKTGNLRQLCKEAIWVTTS